MFRGSLVLLAACSVMLFMGCSDDSSSVTDSGYNYEFFDLGEGESANPGDFVYLDIRMHADEEFVFDSRENAGPSDPMRLPSEGQKTDGYMRGIVEVVGKMSAGDSAVLYIPVDSFIPAPPQLQDKEMIKYDFVATRVMSPEANQAYQNELAAAAAQKLNEKQSMMAQVFADYRSGALDADLKETTEGLQYYIHEAGEGPNAAVGERVTAHYLGVFAENGEMFDSSWKKDRPYPFTVGAGEVIQAWDIGFQNLNKGAKATFFVPYELAYGETGWPPTIAPNSDLIFYVEVVDIN